MNLPQIRGILCCKSEAVSVPETLRSYFFFLTNDISIIFVI